MAGVKHAKVSAKVDGGDTSLVLPSDWNADHVLDDISAFASMVSDNAPTALGNSVFRLGRIAIDEVGIAPALQVSATKSSGTNASIPAGVAGTVNVTGGTLDHGIGVLGWADLLSANVDGQYIGVEGRIDARKSANFNTKGVLGLVVLQQASTFPTFTGGYAGEFRVESNIDDGTGNIGIALWAHVTRSGANSVDSGFYWNAIFGDSSADGAVSAKTTFRGRVQSADGDLEVTINDNATQRLRRAIFNHAGIVSSTFKLGTADANSEWSAEDSAGTVLARIRSDKTLHLNAGTVSTTMTLPVSSERAIVIDSTTGWAFMVNSLGQLLSMDYPTSRSRDMAVYVNPGAATITTLGLAAAPTLTATASSADSTDGPWMNHATTNVSANPSGVVSAAFTILRRDWEPEYGTTIKTDPTTIANTRIWVGMFSASPDASATPAVHIAAFRYDTGADGTAFWRCVTDNASGAPTVTTTTTAIAANTKYTLRIRTTNAGGGHVYFYINEVLVADHTLKLPTSTQLMGYGNRIVTLTTAIRNLKWGRIEVFHG
jgi:hypothetical protein